MPDWLLVSLAMLTCYRATRLATRDDFPPLAWMRGKVIGLATRRRWQWLEDLASCYWCASGWVAIGLTALAYAARPVAEVVCFAGAVWTVGALLADNEGKP